MNYSKGSGAKADERQVLDQTPALAHALATNPARQIMIGDKNYYDRKGEEPRSGQRFFKPLRQVMESVSDTFKANSTSSTTAASRSPASAPELLNEYWH